MYDNIEFKHLLKNVITHAEGNKNTFSGVWNNKDNQKIYEEAIFTTVITPKLFSGEDKLTSLSIKTGLIKTYEGEVPKYFDTYGLKI